LEPGGFKLWVKLDLTGTAPHHVRTDQPQHLRNVVLHVRHRRGVAAQKLTRLRKSNEFCETSFFSSLYGFKR
jgi:hypothetical protein